MSETASNIAAAMPVGKGFELLGPLVSNGCAARLGRLSIPGRRVMETPSYVAVASRGAIPHLTPDNLARHTNLSAAYMALEDFFERGEPPIYNTPQKAASRRLHNFTALASDRITVLGARRYPAVMAPMGNAANSVTLFTSKGFTNVNVPQYVAAVEKLQPDVVVPLSDSLHSSPTPATKKQRKMVDRTEQWVDEFLRRFESREHLDQLGISVFAPVLPVELVVQWDYLRHLAEDVTDYLSGLAIHDVNLIPELKAYANLDHLPRLSFDPPRSPHDVLSQISLGVDICALPFVNGVTDAGIALTFAFPPPRAETPQPLGINMWSKEHVVAMTPLQQECRCYACSRHTRAYLQHLLNAKEMLGWNLLQIHNHFIIDKFFDGIRAELRKGLDNFDENRRSFTAAYESHLPEGTGERPRARGYHFKSEAGQEKINKAPWVADL